MASGKRHRRRREAAWVATRPCGRRGRAGRRDRLVAPAMVHPGARRQDRRVDRDLFVLDSPAVLGAGPQDIEGGLGMAAPDQGLGEVQSSSRGVHPVAATRQAANGLPEDAHARRVTPSRHQPASHLETPAKQRQLAGGRPRHSVTAHRAPGIVVRAVARRLLRRLVCRPASRGHRRPVLIAPHQAREPPGRSAGAQGRPTDPTLDRRTSGVGSNRGYQRRRRDARQRDAADTGHLVGAGKEQHVCARRTQGALEELAPRAATGGAPGPPYPSRAHVVQRPSVDDEHRPLRQQLADIEMSFEHVEGNWHDALESRRPRDLRDRRRQPCARPRPQRHDRRPHPLVRRARLRDRRHRGPRDHREAAPADRDGRRSIATAGIAGVGVRHDERTARRNMNLRECAGRQATSLQEGACGGPRRIGRIGTSPPRIARGPRLEAQPLPLPHVLAVVDQRRDRRMPQVAQRVAAHRPASIGVSIAGRRPTPDESVPGRQVQRAALAERDETIRHEIHLTSSSIVSGWGRSKIAAACDPMRSDRRGTRGVQKFRIE